MGHPDYPHFSLADYKFRDSYIPFRFDNSLEQLTELRETVLNIYWFIKDTTQEEPDRRDAEGKI